VEAAAGEEDARRELAQAEASVVLISQVQARSQTSGSLTKERILNSFEKEREVGISPQR
jgi:hypothetical protein